MTDVERWTPTGIDAVDRAVATWRSGGVSATATAAMGDNPQTTTTTQTTERKVNA